jgi:hypothetical protein
VSGDYKRAIALYTGVREPAGGKVQGRKAVKSRQLQPNASNTTAERKIERSGRALLWRLLVGVESPLKELHPLLKPWEILTNDAAQAVLGRERDRLHREDNRREGRGGGVRPRTGLVNKLRTDQHDHAGFLGRLLEDRHCIGPGALDALVSLLCKALGARLTEQAMSAFGAAPGPSFAATGLCSLIFQHFWHAVVSETAVDNGCRGGSRRAPFIDPPVCAYINVRRSECSPGACGTCAI